MAIPERMNKVSSRALAAEESRPWLFPDKNSRIKVIKRGRRPLQGTKLFVTMHESVCLWGVDNTTACDPCCVAAKSHCHGKSLFPAGFTALERPV